MTIKRMTIVLVVMVALILVGTQALAQTGDPGLPTTTHDVQPIFVDNNPSCSDVATDGTIELKIEGGAEGVQSGEYTDNTLTVEIDVYNTQYGQAFDFVVLDGGAIADVVVKGGPDANWYNYDGLDGDGEEGPGLVLEDTFLHAPVNDSNGKHYGLSHISFCYFPTFTKSGTKFHDHNANGVQDTGDEGLSGWVIRAYEDDGDGILSSTEFSNGPAATDTTDTNGDYSMELPAGTDFIVCEVLMEGWFQSAPSGDAATGDCSVSDDLGDDGYAINLSGDDPDNDFGNFQNATKSGVKYHDLNANGQRDEGEPGLDGWTINLVGTAGDGSVVNESETTADGGKYSFSVAPGTYTVSEVCPTDEGWRQSEPGPTTSEADCGNNAYENIILTSGETESGNDFGNFKNAAKSGVKYHDLNANGQRDEGEPGLDGWTINLTGTAGDGSAVSESATTADGGKYSFSVAPGTYTVSEVCPTDEGWRQSEPGPTTSEADCGNNAYENIILTSGETESGNDFGNFKNATKAGVKYKDANADGIKDEGEQGLEGWTIEVYADDGETADVLDAGDTFLASVDTDSDGNYSFTLDPGDYIVCEVAQDNWEQTAPSNNVCGTGAGGHAITLISGQNDNDNHFGNTPLSKFDVRFFDLTGSTNATIECNGESVGPSTGTTPSDTDPELTLTLDDLKIGEYTCKIIITDP